jgi:tRNA(Ile)-lysidine synthase
MQKHFLQAMEKIGGLINLWSALSKNMSGLQPARTDRILVAVSGGVDSMCLADLFLKNYGADKFAVAHCNFCLRADESDADESLVRSWAEINGVYCHVNSFDTRGYAITKGISIEMAARELRYNWFDSLCSEYGYTALAVAHNANDNAETLILNLLRGTGLRGLSAMSLISDIPCCDSRSSISGARLIRPILDCTRKMIEGYAFVNRLSYREDSTNASSDYKRNRVRNEIFPLFEKINPSFVRTLNREIGYFTDAARIVDEYCAPMRNLKTMNIQDLLSQKHWRYLLYYMLEPFGFNSATIASVEELLESDRTISGKRFESDTHELVIERTDICVRPKRIASQADSEVESDPQACVPIMPPLAGNPGVVTVHGPGIYNFNGQRWQAETLPYSQNISLKQPAGVLIADADILTFPFVCRGWRRGDWMIPFGMKGRKKVSDIFSDLKFTSVQKEQAVIIVDCKGELPAQQHVAGIVGLRIDDRYKITDDTKTIIRITVLR